MNIYLVDDNDKFRAILRLFIEEHLRYKIIGESNDGKSFLDSEFIDADIILMDINMPGINGLEATKHGLWKYSNYKIIAVSQYTDTVDLTQLIGIGFKGFVSKVNLFKDLDAAIKKVEKGGLFFPDEVKIKYK